MMIATVHEDVKMHTEYFYADADANAYHSMRIQVLLLVPRM